MAVMFAYIAGSPFVFIELYGVSPSHYGWLFGLNAFGLIAGSQWNARLLRRHAPGWVLDRGLKVLVAATAVAATAAVTANTAKVTNAASSADDWRRSKVGYRTLSRS